jgi:hypothetical protein
VKPGREPGETLRFMGLLLPKGKPHTRHEKTHERK